MQAVRPPERIPEKIPALPHLFSRTCLRRIDPWSVAVSGTKSTFCSLVERFTEGLPGSLTDVLAAGPECVGPAALREEPERRRSWGLP